MKTTFNNNEFYIKFDIWCEDEHEETDQLYGYLRNKKYKVEVGDCSEIIVEYEFGNELDTKDLENWIKQLDKDIQDFYENVFEGEEDE